MTRPIPSAARRPGRGFTLIELLVTLAVTAVLAAVAAPSVRTLLASSRLKSHNGALQESLMLARTEAIKRQARVVVCKSSDQASCAGTGNWEQGWIVFVDTNDSASTDAGEPILLKVPALSGSFLLTGSGNVGDYVSYTGSGAAKETASQVFQTGVFSLCQPGLTDARQIEVYATGRLSLRRDPVTTCPP